MPARLGRLVREIPVRLLNISSSGFLFESHKEIRAGATGTLHVDLGSVKCLSPVGVSRSVRVVGSGDTFHAGGEFAQDGLLVTETRAPTAPPHREADVEPARPDDAHTAAPHVTAA